MNPTNMFSAYVFVNVDLTNLVSVKEQLKNISGISVVAPVTGRFDLLVQITAQQPAQLIELVNKIRQLQGIHNLTTYIAFDGVQADRKIDGNQAFAYSLVNIRKPWSEVLASLKTVPAFLEAYTVLGDADAIVKIQGRTYEELLTILVTQFPKIDGIRTTETLFAYQPWTRA